MTQPASINKYMLDGRLYVVDSGAKLGAGNEGTVYGHPYDAGSCVKIFHQPDPGAPDELKLARFRARKVASICRSRPALPRHFVLPDHPAQDAGGKDVIGFSMRRVQTGYHKLMQLLDTAFRTDQQLGLRFVSGLFGDLFEDLGLVHDLGLAIGDVNLGSVMFSPSGERAWVDTDSWSYPGFDCQATSQLFAHPDLYTNLTPGGDLVAPEPRHDRFAFLVAYMLTALPGSHPFGAGQHRKVRGLMNRAKAGITLFDDDVTPPAMLVSPEVLSDKLLDEIIRRLKRQTEDPLDPGLLRDFAGDVRPCGTCGTEYHNSRSRCPQCQAVAMIQMPAAFNFIISELFKAPGTLLFAQAVGQDIWLVCRTGDEVRIIRLRMDGTTTTLSPTLPNVPGARYRFFKDHLVVCPEPTRPGPARLDVYRLDSSSLRPTTKTTSGVLEGASAVFDTSGEHLYRTTGNALVRCQPFGKSGTLVDTQIATVHQKQHWFTVDHSTGADREAIVGFDRAFRQWQWFVILGNTKGSRYQYHPVGNLGLDLQETVQEYAVYFSESSALIVLHTTMSGREYVRYVVVGFDGTVHANRRIGIGDPDYELWTNIRGKLYQGKSVLHATADGVVKQVLATGETTTLSDTTGHVTNQDHLIRLGGQVGFVSRSGIAVMARKPTR